MNIAGLLQMISAVVWVVVVVVAVFILTRAAREHPIRRGGLIIVISVVVGVLLSALSAGIVFINPEERGIVISALAPSGYRTEVLQPGLRWVIPFFESVTTYPISKQTYTMSIAPSEGDIAGDDSIAARTADGQQIYVDASVIFSANPADIVSIHINWKGTYDENLVRPLTRGVIRDAVSQFGVEEINSSKRAELSEEIRSTLEAKLAANGVILHEFILRNITYSDEYAASVEQKQIAEQKSQEAKFVVETKKQEAEQARQIAQGQADAAVIASKGAAEARLIEAQAEAQALKLIADQVRDNPAVLNYLYINKLSPAIKAMLVPSQSGFIMSLPESYTDNTLDTTVVPTVTP